MHSAQCCISFEINFYDFYQNMTKPGTVAMQTLFLMIMDSERYHEISIFKILVKIPTPA